MKLNMIDLFSGCGGLTDGFMQTGKYQTLAAVDWESPTVNTLSNRLSKKWGYECTDKKVICFDLQRTDELLNGYTDIKYGSSKGLINLVNKSNVDLIVGGPPCQAYSIAGRVRDKNRMQDDYRNYLFESYVKLVSYFKPKAFVFENVEGILSAKPGGVSIVDRIRKAFLEINYEITNNLKEDALFDTSYYGIPQKRKRVIIYGVQKSRTSNQQIESFYSLMKSKKKPDPTIVKDAFKDLAKIYPLDKKGPKRISHVANSLESSHPKNHEPRFHNRRDVSIFKILAKDIKNQEYKYTNTQSLIQLYKEQTGKSSKFHKYHVIREDRPSNTIPAHLYKDGLRHIHPDPEQARSITVREAARIQTFDDDFEFLGSKGDQYKMVGNAVPPKFSKLIAEVVFEINNNIDYTKN
jgi:DNA (cytosine-5)-methyltransferase 1